MSSSWLRTLREEYSKRYRMLRIMALIVLLVFFLGFFSMVVFGYIFDWYWVGVQQYTSPPEVHPARTLWDWLQLLIIPAVLAAAALLFNARQSRTEQRIAQDREQETTLGTYQDRMSDLLLKEHLGSPTEGLPEVQQVARARTLTTLRRLDPNRKGIVLQFLYDAGLINKDNPIVVLSSAPDWIDLRVADLSKAKLRGADLHGAGLGRSNLHEADLREANLEQADLKGVDLSRANMSLLTPILSHPDYLDPRSTRLSKAVLDGADLSEADLRRADLREAFMNGAKLDRADLSYAHLEGAHLEGATLIETILSGAYLNNAMLYGVNLRKANLRGARLQSASLTGSLGMNLSPQYDPEAEQLSRGADLSGADLQGADLSEADLRGANLRGARLDVKTQLANKWRLVWEIVNQGAEGRDLSRCDLGEANLTGAKLRGANLSGANLTGAILSEATLSGADLTGANLTGVIGWTQEQLDQAKFSNHAIPPDGYIPPP